LCLECHEDDSLTMGLGQGREMSVFVDIAPLGGSVHRDLQCATCHRGYPPDGHESHSFSNRRAFIVASSQLCRRCHQPTEGLHGRMLAGLKQLVCTDCHGGHTVQPVADDPGCLGCHSYQLEITFANGETTPMVVHPEGIEDSVHADLACEECHEGFSRDNHPVERHKSRREMSISLSQRTCRECHFDKYTRTLEGIHYKMLEKGREDVPVCVDCHGSHEIGEGRTEKLSSARRCRNCHEEIFTTYTQSVHGKALVSEHSQDVPICSDCHQAHNISDPRTADFQYDTPTLCGNCHANEPLMARYGLSTAVLKSYLEDFHGVTASYYQKEGGSRRIAVCTDCHGIHDITPTHGAGAAALKATLVERCRTCHEDASDNFPDAWLSHYEPSFERAPLVYAVHLGYRVFIPFMVIGLALQVLLHIWRYAVRR